MTDRGRLHDPRAALSIVQPESLDATFSRLDARIDWMIAENARLHADHAAWEQERARIAQILDTFSRAPISMASIQPVLNLAIEMNKEPK